MPFLHSFFKNGKSTPTFQSHPATDIPFTVEKGETPSSSHYPQLVSRSCHGIPRISPIKKSAAIVGNEASSGIPTRPPRPPAPLFTTLPPPVPPPQVPVPVAPSLRRQRSSSSASLKLHQSVRHCSRLAANVFLAVHSVTQ
jgi:hypothetical protein